LTVPSRPPVTRARSSPAACELDGMVFVRASKVACASLGKLAASATHESSIDESRVVTKVLMSASASLSSSGTFRRRISSMSFE
jgi:hypothetical protein